MDGAIIFLIVFLLLAMIGGAVYFFWYRQYSCNNRSADTSSNVATWLWSSDDSACYANTCTDTTFTKAKDGFSCSKKVMKQIGTMNCGDGTKYGTPTPSLADSDCNKNCTGDSSCMGYSLTTDSGKTTGTCDLLNTVPTKAGTAAGTCYSYSS
jgi:hypothetical protein